MIEKSIKFDGLRQFALRIQISAFTSQTSQESVRKTYLYCCGPVLMVVLRVGAVREGPEGLQDPIAHALLEENRHLQGAALYFLTIYSVKKCLIDTT